VHHVRADASAVLLLPDDDPVLERIREAPGGTSSAMLELADHAPVDLRQPVRALLWITGTLRLPDLEEARRLAVHVADVRPHPDLLQLGHGATLVRLDPGSTVLSDAEGSAALAPLELAAARPDPFCRYERHWLTHLEEAHPEVLAALARHLPPALLGLQGTRLRPLSVDRCGLRLRIEVPGGVENPGKDHDVRLAWQDTATTMDELRVQMRLLVGCPVQGTDTGRQFDGTAS
jgi:hypothetical protein